MEVSDDTLRVLLLDGKSRWEPGFWRAVEEIRGSPVRVEERDDADVALQSIADGAWDVVLLDFAWGETAVSDLLRGVRELPGPPPVIIISESFDRQDDLDCMRAGAAAFLPRERITPESLEQLIRYAVVQSTAVRELCESLRLRDHFLSLVAHDVRGPLAVLASGLELYARRFPALPQEKVEKFLRQAEQQTRQMQALTTQVLDWASSQSKDFHPYRTSFLFQESFDSVMQTLRPLAEGKSIRVENQVPANTRLHVDRNMWETILRNLISNSIKFSCPESSIQVSCENQAGRFRVRVRDRGIGMSQHQLERLLEGRSIDVRRGTGNEKGTGLGVQLCLRFAELHGGRLEIESVVDEGTSVTVDLPGECLEDPLPAADAPLRR